jgi:hypothetical protein
VKKSASKGPRRILVSRREGMVLISTLLILASVSLIALGMSSDTTSEVRIAGNRKQFEQAFHLADGAADMGVQVILDHMDDAVDPEEDYPDSGTFTLLDGKLYLQNFRMDENLYADIQGYPQNDNEADPDNGKPDVAFSLTAPAETTFAATDVTVDIDRLGADYLAGSSIEFAAGYEGVGKGAGAGTVAVYLAVHTRTSPQGNSALTSEVTTVYRKVSQVIGGGQ